MFGDLNSSSYSIKVIFEKNMREIYSKEELKKLKPNQYKRLLGVDFAIVCKMETIVEKSYTEKHKKGGRKNRNKYFTKPLWKFTYCNTKEIYGVIL